MKRQMTLFDYAEKPLSVEHYSNPALLKDIPFDEVYEAARKEASRKKPVFFIHKYFARRITINFRMMLLGSLLAEDADIWENFYKSFDGADLHDFTVLDPFMGGGTTIFEACRLKTKVVGCDLQPLSKFVTRALIEQMDVKAVKRAEKALEKTVAKEIMKYQRTKCPECGEQADVMYTFHAKRVSSHGVCKEHVLFSNFVLALKKNTFTLVCPECGEVYEHNFKEDGPAKCPSCDFEIADPKEGYVDHGTFKCRKCGEEHVVSDYTEENGYPKATKLIAIEYYCPHCKGHGYKKIEDADQVLYDEACTEYRRRKDELPIPDQDIPVGYNTNQILNHGYKKFSDLFNERQLLELGILLKAINELEDKRAQFWLQLAFSGMLEMNNMFCRYQANAYKICNIFFNHAYVPIAMPVENNVWGTKLGTGNFVKTLSKIIRGKEFCSNIYDISTVSKNGKIEVEKKFSDETVEMNPVDKIEQLDSQHPLLHCGDSRNLEFIPDASVDMVLTDPPFGANVMYSELIDFFHVWNYKSTLANELGFVNPLSPKEEEIIVNTTRNKTQEDYSAGLESVFIECHRVLKDDGFLIFSFHDKSVESWISILESIEKSGFSLIKAYPLHAETRTGAHTSNKNSIALDIMLICKKRKGLLLETMSVEVEKEIDEHALQTTEAAVKRLTDIDAEITIPDVENIYISAYFYNMNKKEISVQAVKSTNAENLNGSIARMDSYFEKYDLSSKRTGWWSELYKEKWNI